MSTVHALLIITAICSGMINKQQNILFTSQKILFYKSSYILMII